MKTTPNCVKDNLSNPMVAKEANLAHKHSHAKHDSICIKNIGY